MRGRATIIAAATALATLIAGCAAGPLTVRERGALGGAALGAGTGAIIGNQTGHPGAGAAIGGGLGALTGALIGDQMESGAQHRAYLEDELAAQRAEIERQRREIEALRRERYDRGDSYGGRGY